MLDLGRIKHLALDLDGTLYLDGKLFDWTQAFLHTLSRLGIGRTFFTNNSSKSTRQYIQRLRHLGIDANESDLYSSTTCVLDYLREERPAFRRLYVLGTEALREEFSSAGYQIVGQGPAEQPDAVIAGFDTTLTYDRVCRASWWISKGKEYIATHCDRICPTSEPTVLVDCGAICAMLTAATGRPPDIVLGKPHPRMLAAVMRRHDLSAPEIAVVGDRLYTDMAMAQQAGSASILVLSGETKRLQAEAADPRPDLILANVGKLGELLESRREARC